jgi:AT-hook transcription factor
MADRSEFVRGWMSGWAAATSALTQSLSQALRSGTSGAVAALAETAGNKPTGRRRGRPPKAAGMAQPQTARRRGRPPKAKTP